MNLEARQIFGREAIDLAKVLRCTVRVSDRRGSTLVFSSVNAEHELLPQLIAEGAGARISLNVDDAADELTRRVRELARGSRPTWWAIAMLCAVERVLREYEQP